MADFPRLLSRPVLVRWAGWEADTLSLQQNGWELSVDQDPMRMRMRMVIRNQEHGFIGQTNNIPFERWSERDMLPDRYDEAHIWQMHHLARSIMVPSHEIATLYDVPIWDRYKPIDAMPRMVEPKWQSLEDLVHFAELPLVRSPQAIILPEARVDDLLAAILERQQGAKTMHFKELAAREGQVRQAQKFHAQIISLADYRAAA